MAQVTEYALKVGTVNNRDITSSDYVINWAKQADQNRRWSRPVDPSSSLREYYATAQALDGSQGFIGRYNWTWFLPWVTPKMVNYIKTTIFSNAADVDVTVVTWDRNFGWRTLNAKAQWKDPASTAQPAPGMPGWYNFQIGFVEGVIADPGGGFSSGFSSGFDLVVPL